MRNILLAVESVIILVFCISWCFCLQKNFDSLQAENLELRTELHEVRENTEREIRVIKTDLDIQNKGWK